MTSSCAALFTHAAISVFLGLLFSSSKSAAQVIYDVDVGIPTIVGPISVFPRFDPPYIDNVFVSDTVRFNFRWSGNHSTTQTSYTDPCNNFTVDGFDTGSICLLQNSTDPVATFSFPIESLGPFWFVCRTADHCENGMVFAINPAGQYDNFRSQALIDPPVSLTATTASLPSQVVGNSGGTPNLGTATLTVSGEPTVLTYTSYPGSAAPTSGVPSDHVVVIGGAGQLVFDPTHILAQPGDTISFYFASNNHSVTQSTFSNPCMSLSETSSGSQAGFDSGFRPVMSSSMPSNFTILINDTDPIWAFCGQTLSVDHCAQGMVFAANTVESGSSNYAAFREKAMLSTQSQGNQGNQNTSSDQIPQSPTSNSRSTAMGYGVYIWLLVPTALLVTLL